MATRQIVSAAAFAAALSLVVAGGVRAAQKRAPLIPRERMLSVDEVRPGMKGIGKSVFAGTRIESFGVTVLGVMRRVDFGGDIILVSIDSGPPVTKGFGVISGMSGSPVYIKGKLIGALAYTWPFAKRPIAGITPIAQMLDAFEPGSSPVRQSGTVKATQPFVIGGQRVERASVTTGLGGTVASAAAGMTLVPVATPIMVSGMNASALSVLRAAFEPMGLTPVTGAGSMEHINTRLEPGSAVGARLMGGDLDVTAVGTVTYVNKDVVLAFGHTMSSLGSADIPLVAAYVHGIMASSELSFKLASGGQMLGRFTEDRPWCIGGRLGKPATLVKTSVRITDQDRKVTREYGLEVVRNRSLTTALLAAAMAGAIRSVGPPSEGTTRVSFSLDAEGLPRLTRQNIYAVGEDGGLLALLLGPSAATASATEELNQILDALQSSEFGEAKLTRLGISVEMSKRRRVARLERVTVNKHQVKPGDEVEVTTVLRAANVGQLTRVDTIRVPENCPPGRVQIGIAGGRSAEWLESRLEISEPRPESLAQMVKQMLDRPSNDQILMQMALPTVGLEARGQQLRDLPPAVMEVLRSSSGTRLRPLRDYVETRTRTDWMVSGYSVVSLMVEGDEKDKGGRPPSPQAALLALDEMPSGLMGIFSGLGLSSRAMAVGPEIDEGDQPDFSLDGEVPMPSWEDVGAVGEGELVAPAGSGEPSASAGPKGAAVGRLASIWRLSTDKDFSLGKWEGMAVLSTGGLMLAPKPSLVSQLTAHCVWPIAVGPDGSVYTGTWSDGKLWRTSPDGKTSVLLETKDAAVQALTMAQDGTLYAAAIPSGTVYRVKPGGRPAVLATLPAPSIWALAVAQNGDLWAATGPEGKLFRIRADGTYSVAFTAADRHIIALAGAGSGALYLATSPRGKVYRIGADGAARSVFEVEKSSAQSIAVDPSGNVYVGTSPDARVIRIDTSGVPREILKAKGKHVMALYVGGDGVVYAAVGPEAAIYVIRPDGGWANLHDPKTAFVSALAADAAGGIYFAAADTGRVVRLDSATKRTGSYLSPVRDAGAGARWARARWQGSSPDGTSASVWTRTGDTAHPDVTWSDWQATPLVADGLVQSPAGRFLQCRVDLASDGPAAPSVESLEVTYLPANRPPEVTLTAPKAADIWSGKKTIRWSGRDPDKDKLNYEASWSADGGKTWTKIETPTKTEPAPKETSQEGAPKADAKPGAEPKSGAAPKAAPTTPSDGPADKVALGVRAVQDSGDEDQEPPKRGLTSGRGHLTATDGKGEEQQEEAPTEKEQPAASAGPSPLTVTSLEWDTSKVADGTYVIKVIGSDSAANPADPRQAEAISRSLVVDNTAPELIIDRGRQDTDQPPSDVTAFDFTTYITSAEFRIDSGPWLAAMAKDGIFDGRMEAILLDTARVPPGAHQVEVRVRDAAGNAASATLRYSK